MVRSDTCCDSDLELLRLCKTLSSEVTGVETEILLAFKWKIERKDARCGDNNFSVNQLLVELGVLSLLVGGGDESVSLVLEPFADAKLVLSCA